MAIKDYYAQHGQSASPWLEGWDDLSDWEKERIKQGIPQYQGPGDFETEFGADFLARLEEGPDTNIFKGLGEAFGVKPGDARKFVMGMMDKLRTGTDFAEEYGVGKQALQQELRSAERGVYKRGAARGLLDSSATQAQIGGARGDYANSLAELMMWKGTAEEQSRQFNQNALGRMGGQGMDFAQFINNQWAQEMGFRGETIKHMSGERGRRNQFEQQANQQWGWDSNNFWTDVLPGLLETGMSFANIGRGGTGDDGGGSNGGGGSDYNFSWDDNLNQPFDPSEELSWYDNY